MADYLQYWKHDANHRVFERGGGTQHSAGNQLGRVQVGDRVWIVTVVDGDLRLIGRINVEYVVNQTEAARILDDDDLWESKWHVIGKRNRLSDLKLLSLGKHALRLRFEGSVTRLPKGFTGQSLQVLRRLTPESARDLEEFCRSHGYREPRKLVSPAIRQALEGDYVEARRYVRARSKQLRLDALRLSQGVCAACHQDFSGYLQGLGRHVLQVHHNRQLSKLTAPRLNTVEDLSVLCANCHSIIHADPRRAMSVRQLRRLIAEQTSR